MLFEQPLLWLTSSGQKELIKECFSFDVSMPSDSRVLFVEPLSQLVLSDPEELITAGVQFDVSLPALSPGGDLVRPGLHLLVSGDACHWGQLLVTTSECTMTDGLVCCGWLHSVTLGAWLVAPPISGMVRAIVIGCGCWLGCIWIVDTCQKSVEVLRLTGSLVLQILICCLTDVCFYLLQICLTVLKFLPVSSCRHVPSAGDQQPGVYGYSIQYLQYDGIRRI